MGKTHNTTDCADLISHHCLCYRLRKLNRVVTSMYDTPLKPLSITLNQVTLLVVAERRGLARPAEVCQLLQMDVSTLSRNVTRMRANGWLETILEEDARAHPFCITTKGRRLLQQAYPAWEEAQRKTAALLGDDGVALLLRVDRTIDEG